MSKYEIDLEEDHPVKDALSFSELEEAVRVGDVDAEDAFPAPYAVDGQDTSGFVGVSEEYRTYASEVDSPLGFDPSVADNSQEKLDALADAGVPVADEWGHYPADVPAVTEDSVTEDSSNGDSAQDDSAQPKKAAAKKAAPPLQAKSNDAE